MEPRIKTINRFTSWPQDQFFMPNPLETDVALKYFCPMFVIPSSTYLNEQYFSRSRESAIRVNLQLGRCSTVPYDFVGVSNTDPFWQQFNALTLTSTSAPEYTGTRTALTQPVGQFSPRGVVERVLMVPAYVPPANPLATPPEALASTQITSVREVSIGDCAITNGNLNVSVRAAQQKSARNSTPGTSAISTLAVRLDAVVTSPGGSTNLIGPLTGSSLDTNGRVTIPVPLSSVPANAHIKLRAWMDQNGTTTALFDENRVAWASYEVSRGTVVTLTARPDVGDDKNTASAKRAKLVFKRTGSLSGPLPVTFTLPGAFTAPNGEDLVATYGTTVSADYYLQATGAATLSPTTGIPTTVTIPTNEAEAVVDIVTRADNVTEEDLVRVQLATSPNYAIGSQDRVNVMIYDGPEWTLYELADPYSFTVSSSAGGVNEGAFDSSGGWSVLPQVAGAMVTTPSGGGTSIPSSAWWSSASVFPNSLVSGSFIPSGISQRTDATTRSVVVGNSGNSALRMLDNATVSTVLKNLETAQPISAVLGINPDASWYVGRSRKQGSDRPVSWSGTVWTNPPADLAAGIASSRVGVAYAVNNAGAVAGEFQMSAQSGTGPNPPTIIIKRGFRMPSAGQALSEANDVLKGPGEILGSPRVTSANGLSSDSRASGSWNVVGNSRRAASWQQDLSGAQDLGVWEPVYNGLVDVESEARGINRSGWLVGWSRPATGYSRAVFRRSSAAVGSDPPPWIDLNDPHAVYGLSGWNLLRADAITDSGVIIGQGRTIGYDRGFFLVRRSSEN